MNVTVPAHPERQAVDTNAEDQQLSSRAMMTTIGITWRVMSAARQRPMGAAHGTELDDRSFN